MTLTAPSGPTIRTVPTSRLDELRADDAPLVGAKAAHLGELAAAGFAVPRGFVVPASAYLDAIEAAGERAAVADAHRHALLAEDEGERARLCIELADRVRAAGMSEGLPDGVPAGGAAAGAGRTARERGLAVHLGDASTRAGGPRPHAARPGGHGASGRGTRTDPRAPGL